ncbi:AraC family transcriptional regulator [Komagataeibacter rhaeticus]|nr:AraC family transcriptional regulator [Komagataeibacter rhaeticus]
MRAWPVRGRASQDSAHHAAPGGACIQGYNLILARSYHSDRMPLSGARRTCQHDDGECMMSLPITNLRQTMLRHALDVQTYTPVPGLVLFHSVGQTLPMECLYQPRLCMIVQGSKQVTLGERVFTYNTRKYLIATVDLPVTSCVTQASTDRPYLSLSLDLDPAEIAALLLGAPPVVADTRTPPGLCGQRADG